MIRAVSVDIALNLSQFSRRLTVAGIAHRVVEESGQQTIWVHSEDDVQAVKQQLAHWLKSALHHSEAEERVAGSSVTSASDQLPISS